MSSLDVYLLLHGAEAGDDAERATRQLRRELIDLDFSVRNGVPSDPLPDGAKSGSAVITELVVTLGASGGALVALIGVLRDWLNNRSARQRVSVTIGGDTLELGESTGTERERIIEAWVLAHVKGE